jgi:hypothetical protein
MREENIYENLGEGRKCYAHTNTTPPPCFVTLLVLRQTTYALASRIGQNMLCVYLCFVSSNQMEIKITNKLRNAMQNLATQALFEL